jgi:hypothetical protein
MNFPFEEKSQLAFVVITLFLGAGVAEFGFQPHNKHRRKANHQTDRETKNTERFIHIGA